MRILLLTYYLATALRQVEWRKREKAQGFFREFFSQRFLTLAANVVISAEVKKKVTAATAVGKQLWVSGKLGGVNLCMTFNFYDMQVVAVKYGQILAKQHGEEHGKQNPKNTAT